MVEAKIRTFAKDCDLSPNMIDRSSYIVKLLETVSSGLPKEKNEKPNKVFKKYNIIFLP